MSKISEFQKRVTTVFHDLKHNEPSVSSPVIPIYQKDVVVAILRVISKSSLQNPSEIKKLASWRRKSSRWFPSQFRVTLRGTKRWSQTQLLDKEDRILFMIEDLTGEAIGHLGFYRFDFAMYSCEVDNVIRGKAGIPGLMTSAIKVMCSWGMSVLGIRSYYLQCFPNNTKAMALYRRCGFKKVGESEHGMIRMKKMV